MITTFEDLESFYSDNPARRRSPEAGYGVHWRLDGWAGTWRVSYVRHTGEVYALFQGPTQAGRLPNGDLVLSSGTKQGPVMTLGTFPIDENAKPSDVYYSGLEQFLADWTERCGKPNGLAWLIQRIDEAQANPDGTPEDEGTPP